MLFFGVCYAKLQLIVGLCSDGLRSKRCGADNAPPSVTWSQAGSGGSESAVGAELPALVSRVVA